MLAQPKIHKEGNHTKFFNSIRNKRVLLTMLSIFATNLIKDNLSQIINAQQLEGDKCVTPIDGSNNINIRTGEGTNNPAFSVLRRNNVLPLLSAEDKEGWRIVEVDGEEGYVTDQYTKVGDCDDLIQQKLDRDPNLVYLRHREYNGVHIFGEIINDVEGNPLLTDEQILASIEVITKHTRNTPKQFARDGYPVAIVFATEDDGLKLSHGLAKGKYSGFNGLAAFDGTFLTSNSYGGSLMNVSVIFKGTDPFWRQPEIVAHELAHAKGIGHSGHMNANVIGEIFSMAHYTQEYQNACENYNPEGSNNPQASLDYYNLCIDLADSLYPPEG